MFKSLAAFLTVPSTCFVLATAALAGGGGAYMEREADFMEAFLFIFNKLLSFG